MVQTKRARQTDRRNNENRLGEAGLQRSREKIELDTLVVQTYSHALRISSYSLVCADFSPTLQQ